MNRIHDLLVRNEKWLKERILEFAGRPDAAAAWSDFFSQLIETAPDEGVCPAIPEPFDDVPWPVLMLDEALAVIGANRAGAELLEGAPEGALGERLPWLAVEVERECAKTKRSCECRLDVTHEGDGRETHYSVFMSDDSRGRILLVLDDVTAWVETQRHLVKERSRASHYLDVVGAVVVVLDASGTLTMINDTGCKAFGYERHELVGRDWVGTVVPREQRDEVRDYFYLLFSGQVEVDSESTNYISPKDGEDRLVQWQNRVLTNDVGMPIGVISTGVDITDQRVVEEALAEKELWLRSTFVALGEAVLILTPDRGIIDANPAAEKMFGMTNAELVAAPVEELHVDGVHNMDFEVRCEEAFSKGEKAMFEFPLRRSNGEIFPSEHSVSLIIGDEGQPLGIVNTIRDISARKRAEQVLRESEEKFRRIFETIEEGYIVTDLQGIIQMVNPATCRLLGYEEEELVGQDMDELYQDKEARKFLRDSLNKGEPIRGLQMRGVRKDGSVVIVEGTAHLVEDELGTPVGMEGTFHDVTKRIEAEKVLREREQQYRAFFENNHAIMLLTDPQTDEIVDANPAAAEFYGHSVEELCAMTMNRINALSQEDVFKEMQKAREENRAYFIMQHVLADSSLRDVEVYSGPIMVRGQQFLYSVIHDVTKRIRLEAEMKTLATTDALTGVDNRHQFFTAGSCELRRAMRYKKPLALLMLDIDYFKSINDNYGHQSGDEVLRALSGSAASMLRESDIFGRLGGEEFAAVLPETGLKRGVEVAERLRERLAGLSVEADGKTITFTVSIGVTLARRGDKIIEDVIKRADEALYKAKRMGRNRVERA